VAPHSHLDPHRERAGHLSGGHGPQVHGHPHDCTARGGSRGEDRLHDRGRLIRALALTAVILVAELVGGLLSNSLALLSDAGHMLTDVSALSLSLVALWIAEKPATLKKTYGFYRMEILSALANGMALLGIATWIVYEAYQRLLAPEPVKLGAAAAVAAIGLGANLVALRILHRSGSMNVRGAFLHVMGDALSSVGVLLGVGVMWLTGWSWVDPAVSVAISAVVVVGAFRLTRDAVDVLLEAVPAHVDLDAVKEILAAVSGVTAVHDLHVWTISSGIYALSAHLVVLDPMVCNNDQILSAVKHDLYDRFGIDHTTIQIESETYAHLGEVH